MTWVLDHLDDLESDFSALHRVDDIHELDGPRFFRMAYRLSAYQGVMKMRVEDEMYREQDRHQAVTQPRQQTVQVSASTSHSGRAERPLAAVAGQHPDLITRVVLK